VKRVQAVKLKVNNVAADTQVQESYAFCSSSKVEAGGNVTVKDFEPSGIQALFRGEARGMSKIEGKRHGWWCSADKAAELKGPALEMSGLCP
jgi:hypothetical protein